jgi:hypothetical protein
MLQHTVDTRGQNLIGQVPLEIVPEDALLFSPDRERELARQQAVAERAAQPRRPMTRGQTKAVVQAHSDVPLPFLQPSFSLASLLQGYVDQERKSAASNVLLRAIPPPIFCGPDGAAPDFFAPSQAEPEFCRQGFGLANASSPRTIRVFKNGPDGGQGFSFDASHIDQASATDLLLHSVHVSIRVREPPPPNTYPPASAPSLSLCREVHLLLVPSH